VTDTTATPGKPAAPRQGVIARLRPLAGRVVRRLATLGDRALHPIRKRSAQARITRLGKVDRAVVLCYGNICRSPYAAAILERAFKEEGIEATVVQGGFFGPGRPSTDTARSVSLARGVSLENHRSRLVTAEDARDASLIIVMEARQADVMVREFGANRQRTLVLGDLDPDPISQRTIADPYGKSAEVFGEAYARIDRSVGALARALKQSR
jgi:low molecular weight protein-tyrosine phosphatase